MSTAKLVTVGGLLTSIAVLCQSVPVFLGEGFVFVTMLSAFPIYLLTRTDVRSGIVACVATAILTSLVSSHEALLFTFTNAPVGFGLGWTSCQFSSKIVIALTSGLLLLGCLCVVTYAVGIPVLGFALPGPLLTELVTLGSFSFVYCLGYGHVAAKLYLAISHHIDVHK